MKKHYAFESARRCGAKTKNNYGKPCRCPAVRNKARCRVHGGAKGSGAKQGNWNALKHGGFTTEAKAFKTELRKSIAQSRKIIQDLI